jgi:hypothetical protein
VRIVVVLVAIACGCNAGIPVRSAETTPRGEVRVMFDITLGGYVPARASADGYSIRANAIWKLPPLMQVLVSAFHIIGADVTISTGLNDACEVGARLSWFRAGAEARCGVANDDGAIAYSVEGALPWLLGSYPEGRWIAPDPWLRTGIELSTRGDRIGIAALHLTNGPERYGVTLPDTLSRSPGRPGAFALVTRRELRLVGVLGGGIAPDARESPYGALAVVAHRVLRAEEASMSMCPMCRDGVRLDAIDSRHGITLVGGLSPFGK